MKSLVHLSLCSTYSQGLGKGSANMGMIIREFFFSPDPCALFHLC